MANRYNWIIASESESSLVPGQIYFVEENKWSTDRMQAAIFSSKVKAEEQVGNIADRKCTVEKQ